MLLRLLFPLVVLVASCSQQRLTNHTQSSDEARLADQVNIEVEDFTLENDMRVLLVPNRILPLASTYLFYDVGSVHEPEGLTGSSHFLEHMLFKGSENFPPGVFDSTIEGSGGMTNAYTNHDSTVYYQNFPAHLLEKVLEMEADRLSNLKIIQYAFESERKVILEERKMRYENSPRGQLFYLLSENVFSGSPYETSVIGEIKDLESVTKAQMEAYYQQHYRPNKLILVVAGDFSVSTIRSHIKKLFGPIKNPEPQAQALPTPQWQDPQWRPVTINAHGESELPIFAMAYPGHPYGEREGFVLDVLGNILATGKSSYLTQALVAGDRPQLSSIYAGHNPQRKAGFFYITGELLPKVSISRLRQSLEKSLKKSCTEAITVRNLEKTKNQYLVSVFDQIKTNAGLASFLGQREFYYGDYKIYRKEFDLLDSITVEELKDQCQKIFSKASQFISIWNKNPKKKAP